MTYFISLDNQVAVEAETEEQARVEAMASFIEILQREQDVVLLIETED